MNMPPPIKACVIGWPIAHSRSPLIHGIWLRELGINGTYERVPVRPDDLGAFLRNLAANGYAGCNITIPHKEAALNYVDEVDDRARRVGAINTVHVNNGRTLATSTDGLGFCSNISDSCPGFDWTGKNILVLGAGGSAAAIIDEILRRGAARVMICNRSPERARLLASKFGPDVDAGSLEDIAPTLPKTNLLINTTSLGMKGQPNWDIDLAALPTDAIVADIVYTPLQTKLLLLAATRGLRTVSGLGMLLHQAVAGFELWFGKRPTVTKDLFDRIASDIDPDYRP